MSEAQRQAVEQPAAIELPLNLSGLTPAWLRAALRLRYPETEVLSVTCDDQIVGTASKLRLRLEYDAAGRSHGLPDIMIAKGGFHGADQMALAGVGYVQEAKFYSEHAPRLPMEVPTCYFAATSQQNGQSIVLLEDLTLRGASFGNATRPLTVDMAAATLEWLAQLHAYAWNAPWLDSIVPWPGVIKTVMDTLLAPNYWEPMLARPLAACVPERLRDSGQVRLALQAMWRAFEQGPRCFIHGDAHLGNMYFLKDGATGFLDWQSPMAGPCFDDVSYSLIGGLDIEDRRRNERELIKHYLECLRRHGVAAPDFDAAWLAYRQQVLHGLMWVATPPQMQPDAIVAANVERFSVAAEDLETLHALGL